MYNVNTHTHTHKLGFNVCVCVRVRVCLCVYGILCIKIEGKINIVHNNNIM